MRIAFLHYPNDPYVEVRIGYFISRRHEVFSVTFPAKPEQKNIPGLQRTRLPYYYLSRIPFLKRLIYGRQIRKITSEHNIDIFYVINALNSYYLKSSNARCNILEIQGSDVLYSPNLIPFLKPFYRHYWKYADGITQDSIPSRKAGLKYVTKEIPNEIIEIGIDFTIFNDKVEKGRIREKYNLNDRPIVLHTRNIKKIYNIDIIIRAIPLVKKLYEDVCFLFTGSEEKLADELRRYIDKESLHENLIFCGWLDHDKEMKYYYKDANITISIPSTDSSPFSVYEAMAIKTPVIVSDLPWLEGKFSNGVHLLAVPPRNYKLLANAINILLSRKVELDLDDAYSIVYERINMVSENNRLEEMFRKCLNIN